MSNLEMLVKRICLILMVIHGFEANNGSCIFTQKMCGWTSTNMISDERFVATDMDKDGTLRSPFVTVDESNVHTRCLEIEVTDTSLFSSLKVHAQYKDGEYDTIYTKEEVPRDVHRLNFEVIEDFQIVVKIHRFMAIKRITMLDKACHDIHLNCTSYNAPCDWMCGKHCEQTDSYKFKYRGDNLDHFAVLRSPLIAKHEGKKCLKIFSEESSSSGFIEALFEPLYGKFDTAKEYFDAGGTKLMTVDVTAKADFKLVIKFKGWVTINKILLEDQSCWTDRIENCTFDDAEGSICGWNLYDSDQGWSEIEGRSIPPGRDHSEGSPNGIFLAFIKDPRNGYSSSGGVISDDFFRNDVSCYRFWYFTSHARKGRNTLTVRYVQNDVANDLLALPYSTEEKWMSAEVTVPVTGKYYLWFVADIADSEGLIAIDDTLLFPGTCASQSTSCSFEDRLCTWSNHNMNDDWKDVMAKTVSLAKLPNTDHSSDSSEGHYLLLTPRPEVVVSATLISMRLEPEMSGSCFKFWKVSPDENSTLEVYQRSYAADTNFTLSTLENPASEWTSVVVPLKSTSEHFYLSIYGELAQGSKTGIAIDDISFMIAKDEFCNFESNNCAWQFNSSFTSWKRLVASQLTLQHDINPGTSAGHLLAWDSHQYYPCVPDALKSPWMRFCSESCVEIWVYLDKDDDVQVNIGYEVEGGKTNNLRFYAGKSGRFWEVGMFDINATDYRIVVQPSSLESSSCIGLVAVDNVKVTQGKCAKQKANCNFEKGLCTWTSSTDTGYWKVVQAKENKVKGSPREDKTLNTGKGYYLFLNPGTYQSKSGYVRASIFSIYASPEHSAKCMKLWVSSPSKTSSLSIKQVDALSKDTTVIYSLKSPTSKWEQIKIPLEKVDYYYYFEIEGSVKVSEHAGIAIDDITFTETSCK